MCSIFAQARRRLSPDQLPEAEVTTASLPMINKTNEIRHRRQLLSSNDHRVTNLPGLSADSGLVHYAGHLLADPSKGGYLFYWLFETPNDPFNGEKYILFDIFAFVSYSFSRLLVTYINLSLLSMQHLCLYG